MDNSRALSAGVFVGFMVRSLQGNYGQTKRSSSNSGKTDISRAGGYLRDAMFWGSLFSIISQRQITSKAASESAFVLRIEALSLLTIGGKKRAASWRGHSARGFSFYELLRESDSGSTEPSQSMNSSSDLRIWRVACHEYA